MLTPSLTGGYTFAGANHIAYVLYLDRIDSGPLPPTNPLGSKILLQEMG